MKRDPKKAPGNAYDTNSYRRAIYTACAKAFGRPKEATAKELAEWQAKYQWAPNQIRHTTGTEVRKMHGLEAAQLILGHASADVTQVYAEADREKGIAIAAKIG